MSARPPIGRAARRALAVSSMLAAAAIVLALLGHDVAATLSLAVAVAIGAAVLRHLLTIQEQGR